jgi:phospholipid transport system substrate-binding protein
MNIAIISLRAAVMSLATLMLVTNGLSAGEPTEEVRDTIDEILAVLADPALAGDGHAEERRQRLTRVAKERIHWETVCRAALGKHWRQRTPTEREAFVSVFTELLEVTYADSLAENFGAFKDIDYTGERVDGPYAVVRVKLKTNRNTTHPIDYTMKNDPVRGWQVIDFTIEGASLVKNYRTQFDDILRKSSFPALLEDLREKVREKSGPTQL